MISTLPYVSRYSKKAKYLQLRVSLKGIEIVLPLNRSFSQKKILKFLEEKKKWIEKQQLLSFLKQTPRILPEHIILPALDKHYSVSYIFTQNPCVTITENPLQQLTLIGNISNYKLCIDAIKQWLKKKAFNFYENQLFQLCQLTQLNYRKLTVRYTVTRWGSCSVHKNISIGVSLLFLPYKFIRYVLIHELCHTRFLNHGQQFWDLVRRFDKLATYHASQLTSQSHVIPMWVYT